MMSKRLLTAMLIGTVFSLTASAEEIDSAYQEMALFGINRSTGALVRYDFAAGSAQVIGTVRNALGNSLLGIEASAYVPGNLNIYGFWADPVDGYTKLVYINTKTGIATPVGQHLGVDPITGAVALKSGTLEKWSVYAVMHLEPGLIGGHFDSDTSTTGGTSTDAHVHEYDDKFDVLGIDAFNFHDAKLQEINDIISENTLFKLITVNANLSPGAMVRVNGGTNNLGDGPYTLGNAPNATELTALSIDFQKNVIANLGLVKTETKRVRSNTPGPNGEYRNGAFTVQALALNADGSPAYTLGSNGAATSGLLWETTLFWHYKAPKTKPGKKPKTDPSLTGRLIRVNQDTGEYESLMELGRAYDNLAGLDGSGGTTFLGTSGADLYVINTTSGTETLVGTVASGNIGALEFAGSTIMGFTANDALIPLSSTTAQSLGPVNLDCNFTNLGTIIFVPLASKPASSVYD